MTQSAGSGGGVIIMTVANQTVVDGDVRADGASAVYPGRGGGAGGGRSGGEPGAPWGLGVFTLLRVHFFPPYRPWRRREGISCDEH